jgi:trehalose 6-phosphate phosphatase
MWHSGTVRNILDRANEPVLAQVACANVLIAFDYDGTLAPIVDDPRAARMRPRTRKLLERMARAYPCVVISGRSQEDALRLLRGIGVFEVIGNHGLEPWRRSTVFADQVRGWAMALRGALAEAEGIVIEDKVYSLAVHYRRALRPKRARSQILEAAADLDDARIVDGKCVVNLIPRSAPHKGMALEKALELLRCDAALYIGDDDTDEDIFALDEPGRVVTVRVEPDPLSRASFFVRDQRSTDHLLLRLLRLRREKGRGGRGPSSGTV